MKHTLAAVLFCLNSFYSYSQMLSDSTVAMIAYWGIGDEVIYNFKETEEEFDNGIKTTLRRDYDIKINVLDSTEHSYKLKWAYENYKTDYKLEPIDQALIEVCEQNPLLLQTDELGRFQSILNWQSMKENAEVIFSDWIKTKELPDSVSQIFQNMVSGMFQNEAQAKFWARDVRFFHYLYGGNYYRNQPMEGVKYYTNPFIKKNMPGYEKAEVLEVDQENMIAYIKVESGIDGESARTLMYDYIKNNLKNFGLQNEEEISIEDIPFFSVQEEFNCYFHIDTGYILWGDYTHRVNLKEDYKINFYEFELQTD